MPYVSDRVEKPEENCPNCGAALERGDDGFCNRCGEIWEVRKAVNAFEVAVFSGDLTASSAIWKALSRKREGKGEKAPQALDHEHSFDGYSPDDHTRHIRFHEAEYEQLKRQLVHETDPQVRGAVERKMRSCVAHWQQHRLHKHCPPPKESEKLVKPEDVDDDPVEALGGADLSQAKPSGETAKPVRKAIGEYRAGEVVQYGPFSIRIENPAGTTRRGKDKDGEPWESLLAYPYGEFVHFDGADGDCCDCFLGPDPAAAFAYVVHQHNIAKVRAWPGGTCPRCGSLPAECGHDFDEDKVLIGFPSDEEALAAYRDSYDDPDNFIGPVTTVPVARLEEWLGDREKEVRKAVAAATLYALELDFSFEKFGKALLLHKKHPLVTVSPDGSTVRVNTPHYHKPFAAAVKLLGASWNGDHWTAPGSALHAISHLTHAFWDATKHPKDAKGHFLPVFGPKKKGKHPLHDVAKQALAHMAGNDPDHAAGKNNIGFNGTDSEFGHSLHEQTALSDKQVEMALKMLHKYKSTQLGHLSDALFGEGAKQKMGQGLADYGSAKKLGESMQLDPGGTTEAHVQAAVSAAEKDLPAPAASAPSGAAWSAPILPYSDSEGSASGYAPQTTGSPAGAVPPLPATEQPETGKPALTALQALQALGGYSTTFNISAKAGLSLGDTVEQLKQAMAQGQVTQGEGYHWKLVTAVPVGIPMEDWPQTKPWFSPPNFAGLQANPPHLQGWKSHCLKLSPAAIDALPYLDEWEKGFLKSNLGKTSKKLSSKQWEKVEKIQKKHKGWCMANPGVIPTLWEIEQGAKSTGQKEAEAKSAAEAQIKAEILAEQSNTEWTNPPTLDTSSLMGGELFPHQKAAGNWLRKAKRAILAFSTGLGKSLSVVAAYEKLRETGEATRMGWVVPKGRLVGTVRDIAQVCPSRKIVLLSGASLGKNVSLPPNVTVFEGSLGTAIDESGLSPVEKKVLQAVRQLKKDQKKADHYLVSAKSGMWGQTAGAIASLLDQGLVKQEGDGWVPEETAHLNPEVLAAIQAADYVVTGYDPVRKYAEDLRMNVDCVAFDESTRLKGKESHIQQQVTDKFAATPYVWYMSATPIPNSPMDLFVQMHTLQPEVFGTLADFKKNHCKIEYNQHTGGYDIKGYKDIQKTRAEVEHLIFHRDYESPDVRLIMPERLYGKESLTMPADLSKVYEAAKNAILEDVLAAGAAKFNPQNALSQLLRLEQISLSPRLLDPTYSGSEPKLEYAAAVARSHLSEQKEAGVDPPKGIIFFSHFLGAQPLLAEHLQKQGLAPTDLATIQGSDYRIGEKKVKTIQEVVDAVNAGKVKCLIASDAAMEGLNLQYGATRLVHLDTPWRPDALEQREGRIYRPGQTEKCNFLRLLMDNPVEKKKDQVVSEKAANEKAIIAGEEVDAPAGFTYNDFLEALGADDQKVEIVHHESDLEQQVSGMQKALAAGILAQLEELERKADALPVSG